MNEIKKIKGRIVNWWYYDLTEKGKEFYRYVIMLDDKTIVEIYDKKKIRFKVLDEWEFFGREWGNSFNTFSYKLLSKYKPPNSPLKFQKKLSEFENMAKKQESEKNG